MFTSYTKCIGGLEKVLPKAVMRVLPGLAVVATIVAIKLQYQTIVSCKAEVARSEAGRKAAVAEKARLEASLAQLQQTNEEKEGLVRQLADAQASNRNLAVNGASARAELKSARAKLAYLFVARAVMARRARSLKARIDNLYVDYEAREKEFAEAAAFYEGQVEDLKKAAAKPPSIEATGGKVKLGDIRPAGPLKFEPPADWLEQSTDKLSAPLTTLIEGWKFHVRDENKRPGATKVPEWRILAEAKFWSSKGRVPKSWSAIELSEENARKLARLDGGLASRASLPATEKRKAPAGPSHTNGTHVHGDRTCPNVIIADLLDLSFPVIKPKMAGGSKVQSRKAAPGPPPLVKPMETVKLTEIQEQQRKEAEEHAKRLVEQAVVSTTLADKSKKSAADKQTAATMARVDNDFAGGSAASRA